jgi:nicotinate-nucleotide adenylyltransferase
LIGVFGGSFNPIHIGHLIIAEYIRCEFNLEKIIFIPAKMPPHKNGDAMASAQHRFNMVSIAIEGNPNFLVSRIELDREGKSYTIDTLSQLVKLYPNNKLCFICGADSLMNFNSWRSIDVIFRLADIIIAGRPNIPEEDFRETLINYRQNHDAHIFCSESPFMDISSTRIRERIKKGMSIKYMVPDKVDRYIKSHGLFVGEI